MSTVNKLSPPFVEPTPERVTVPVEVMLVEPIVAKLAVDAFIVAPVIVPVEVMLVEPIVAKFAVAPVIVPVEVTLIAEFGTQCKSTVSKLLIGNVPYKVFA